ncbi:hypothetical protein F183_A31440 [Bryobacterales bacterium F-183]|nr:hypothetical protein F183_A31440 [Bryobacterales bacterium F-183]
MKLSLTLAVCAIVALAADYTAGERRHWAFQKRSVPAIPAVEPAAANPIDAFIRARLAKEGLQLAAPADKVRLIRRVTFDLTGLPPTPQEVDAFVNDKAPNAYEKLVDRLLASPRYGERWAQHWLDLVRFAETDGFEYDTHRPDAWRYRDYVIKSFNEDKPYTQFLTEQLAGDEIDPANHELAVASGFNRLGALRKNAGNQEVASSRNEVLTEMTNIVGSAMLGVTVGCARCHDHKFDPIRQKDYYRMQAHFAAVQEREVPLTSEAERSAWKAQKDAVDAEVKELKKQMKGLQGEDLSRMQAKVKSVEAKAPAPLPALFSVRNDYGENFKPVHVLHRGEYTKPGEEVHPRSLGVLLPDGAPELGPEVKNPRTELAKWITTDDNPLTARVAVNRIWLHHFGRGLVATPNDFGRMGQRPSHPELLDYLANQFVEGGWKWKPLHRMILLSDTYRQSSLLEVAAAKEKDPDNKLLWRYPKRRLEAEEIRDAMLSATGRLNLKTGGPGVMIPVQQELIQLMYKPEQWVVAADQKEHDRRSVYLIAKRNLRLPFMEVFDSSDMLISCPRREASTHAPQALELLNGRIANEMADALAARLTEFSAKDHAKQVDFAWRWVAGRAPTAEERKLSMEFLASQPLREYALAMFNLNAFLYVE